MNIKAVEIYILDPFKFKSPEDSLEVKEICLYKGAGGCLAALILLVVVSWFFAPRDQPSLFILIPLIVFITVFLSKMKYRRELEELSEIPDEVCAEDVFAEIKKIERVTRNRRSTILMLIAANFIIRERYTFFLSMAIIALFTIYLMFSYLYRFYLINKYCTYLVTFADRRYYGREESEAETETESDGT